MGKLTISEKLNVISECQESKQSDVARRYGISRQAVTKILQNVETYYKSKSKNSLRCVTNRLGQVEEELFQFIIDCDIKCILISGYIERKKLYQLKKILM